MIFGVGILIVLILVISVDGRNQSCHHLQKRNLLFVEKTVCYGELGCFSSGPPFYHPVYRPLSVPPQPPDVVGTTFQLYTRRNRNRPVFLTRKRGKSPFDPAAITRIIVHGFVDNQYFNSWYQRLKDVLLDRADDNVIIVDWTKNNRLPYTVTVANSRLVGAQIANFIKHIHKTYGTSPESFHLIGHSLGAHISGYAGERLHKLGRITGLDPAGPFFRHVPESVRLDPGDAVFVDVIHSDPGINILQGFGSPEDSGDLDFFPGGGDPPGCKKTFFRSVSEDAPTEALGNLISCQHSRAYEFFIFSFNQEGCLMVGVECPSWDRFLSGHCNCGGEGERCAIMGMFAPSSSTTHRHKDRRLFLKVGPERPYCVHQYQVILHLYTLQRYKTYGYETVYADVTAIGNKEKLKAKIKIDVNLGAGHQIKKFLLSTDRPIGRVKSATITLKKTEDHHHHHHSDIIIGKMEINYLYPLPKDRISSKVCRTSEESRGLGGRVFFFSVCH